MMLASSMCRASVCRSEHEYMSNQLRVSIMGSDWVDIVAPGSG